MQRGNSGGPLLDRAGNLLGTFSLKVSHFASNGGSDFAVKSASSLSSLTPPV